MKKFYTALALAAILAAPAFANDEHTPGAAPTPPAACTDCWNGADKKVHFGVSFILGYAAGSQWPNNKPLAFGVAMIPGTLKELSDAQKGGSGFSGKDLAVDALGAGLGVFAAHWAIKRQGGGAVISYKTAMNVF